MDHQQTQDMDVVHSASLVNQANKSFKLGNFKDAKRLYLEATEMLFKAARTSVGPARQLLTQRGSDILSQAKLLENHPRTISTPTSTSPCIDPPSTGDWLIMTRPEHSLADISGLEDAKNQVRMKMIYPFTHSEEAKRLGMKKGGGILLFGPPGNGKTLLAKAVAGEVDAPFISVNAASIMSKWVGEAEQKVEKLFIEARNHPRCVIFIDEVDSLLPKRSSTQSTVMKRVVPQFLSEMDGVASYQGKDPSLLLVAATNEPWNLDEAVMRPGRFDEKIFVGLPSLPARVQIVSSLTQDIPGIRGQDLSEFVILLEGYSGADIVQVIEKSKQFAFLDSITNRRPRNLSIDDLYQSLSEVRPSVSKKTISKYEHFLNDYQPP